MAKQKLTPEKRTALRKELQVKVKAGVPRVEILKSLSKKFGISTEGLRWYYNDISGDGTSKPKKAASAAKNKPTSVQPNPKAPKKAGVLATKAHAPTPSQIGNSLHLPGILTQHTENEFKRFLEAKKLVPQLESSRRREQVLRQSVRNLSRDLRAEISKGRGIQRRIRQLTKV